MGFIGAALIALAATAGFWCDTKIAVEVSVLLTLLGVGVFLD